MNVKCSLHLREKRERETDRQTNRQTDRQRETERDRHTHAHTRTEPERQRETEIRDRDRQANRDKVRETEWMSKWRNDNLLNIVVPSITLFFKKAVIRYTHLLIYMLKQLYYWKWSVRKSNLAIDTWFEKLKNKTINILNVRGQTVPHFDSTEYQKGCALETLFLYWEEIGQTWRSSLGLTKWYLNKVGALPLHNVVH